MSERVPEFILKMEIVGDEMRYKPPETVVMQMSSLPALGAVVAAGRMVTVGTDDLFVAVMGHVCRSSVVQQI